MGFTFVIFYTTQTKGLDQLDKYNIGLVCTAIDRLRHNEVCRLFQSLSVQSVSIQIVFVHQISNDNNRYGPGDLPFIGDSNRLIYIVTTVSCLSKARNIGLPHVSAQLVAFPDDDCWYPSYFWESAIRFFEHAKVGVISTHVMDPGNGLSYGARPNHGVVQIRGGNLYSLPISVGIIINCSIVPIREIYFDEMFGAGTTFGSGEETDMLSRVIKNYPGSLYVGHLSVYHPVSRSTGEFSLSKSFLYGIGFGALSIHTAIRDRPSHLIHINFFLLKSFAGLTIHLCGLKAKRALVSLFRIIGILLGYYVYACKYKR